MGLILAGLGVLGGCTGGGTTSTLKAVSVEAGGTLVPAPTAMVYRTIDDNTADIYLTDLPLARLADPRDNLADLRGQIIHVHMFLVPSAGKTPVDNTACNAAVRYAIIADGAVGVYGGGGFFFPSAKPGGVVFRGGLREASLRLIRATPDFADRLGNTQLSGQIAADLDETVARVIAAKLEELARALPPAKGAASTAAR